MPHQLPSGSYPFKKQHELQLEEHDGVNGRTTFPCISLFHELADKVEIKCTLHMTVKVILLN
jgi:hypothetical protein